MPPVAERFDSDVLWENIMNHTVGMGSDSEFDLFSVNSERLSTSVTVNPNLSPIAWADFHFNEVSLVCFPLSSISTGFAQSAQSQE